MDLSAVQPPSNPKGAAEPTCSPAVLLEIHLHILTKAHSTEQEVCPWTEGTGKEGQGKEMLTQETPPVGMATSGDNLAPERGNEYPKDLQSATAARGALYFPASPHEHTDLRGQIPTTRSEAWSSFAV